MIGTKAKLVAILVAQNNWHPDTAICDRALRVKVVELTQIGCQLNRFPVNLFKVNRVAQVILADFKLNPAIVAGALLARATAPCLLVPIANLNGSYLAAGKFTNPSMDTGLPGNMVPVISTLVHTQQLQHLGSVCGVIIRLDIPFQIGVICTGGMPQHTPDGGFPSSLIPGTLPHETLHGRVCGSILHRPAISFLRRRSGELVVIVLSVPSTLLLDSRVVHLCRTLKLEQHSVRRLPHGCRSHKHPQDALEALCKLFHEEPELGIKVSDGRSYGLTEGIQSLFPRPIRPLAQAVACAVPNKVCVFAVVYSSGVGYVCVPEFLFICVLEVLRIEPTLSKQISHQASDASVGHALGFQEPPDSSFVHETTPL